MELCVFTPILGSLLVAFLLVRFGTEPIDIRPVPLALKRNTLRLFSNQRTLVMLLAYSLFMITLQGVVGFLPTLLQSDLGFSPNVANLAFAMMFVTGIFVRPLSGYTSDFNNRVLIAGIALLIGVIGLLIILTSGTVIVAVLGVVVYAIGQKSFPPAMQSHLMDRFPTASMGGDLGIIRTVYISIGSLGPLYVGFVASRFDYVTAYSGLVVTLFSSGVLVLYLSLLGDQ